MSNKMEKKKSKVDFKSLKYIFSCFFLHPRCESLVQGLAKFFLPNGHPSGQALSAHREVPEFDFTKNFLSSSQPTPPQNINPKQKQTNKKNKIP